jgi:membrane protein YdbS with pleckstrin-like domain
VSDPAPPRPRGWMSLYLVAFALLLAGAACLAVAARGFFESIALLWFSIALSAGALATAVVSVVLPPRHGAR